jgi:osmotically-inducible protein OsmY
MTGQAPKLTAVLFAAVLASTTAFAGRQSAPQPTDLTPQFQSACLPISGLQAFEIGGIVIIRGKTTDPAVAEQAGRFAQSLGFTRIANLVQVIEPPDDAALTRRVERELAAQRSLDGCRFRVESDQGVVNVAGLVRSELQKDMAIQVLRNIDGVKAVHADLQKQ